MTPTFGEQTVSDITLAPILFENQIRQQWVFGKKAIGALFLKLVGMIGAYIASRDLKLNTALSYT